MNPYPAFKHKNIPVVFSIDNNYLPYLCVTIESLIKHSSPDNNYDLLVLHGEDIIDTDKKTLQEFIGNQKNVSIRFINLKALIGKIKYYTIGYLTLAAYYRFYIQKICANYKKVIYLDCDTIILDDIAKLYEIDLEGNIMGAVLTIGIATNPSLTDYITKKLNIPDQSKYFNTGVLLIDIKKITEFDLFQKLINSSKFIEKPLFADQCLINSVCFSQVKFIDNRWNHFVGLRNEVLEKSIIHFIGSKPWSENNIPLKHIFWTYARNTPYYEDILINYIEKIQQKGDSKKAAPDQQLQNFNNDKTALTNQQNQIIYSKIWKITAPFRSVRKMLERNKILSHSQLI